MELVSLVNAPNVNPHETNIESEKYVTHKGCQEWKTFKSREKHREPLLTRAENGPIHCELCGRRAGKVLRRILSQHCLAFAFKERLADSDRSYQLTYYRLLRKDLDKEGLRGYRLTHRLIEELDTGNL